MEVCTIGGFEQVGKNMTAVKVKDDVIIFDAGIYLPAIIAIQEEEAHEHIYNEKSLRRIGALPDDLVLDKHGWTDKVKAIVIGHAHLDHLGALPYLAHRYPQAEIIATPFTMAVFDEILEGEKIVLKNRRRIVKEDSTYVLNGSSGPINGIHTYNTFNFAVCFHSHAHFRGNVFLCPGFQA